VNDNRAVLDQAIHDAHAALTDGYGTGSVVAGEVAQVLGALGFSIAPQPADDASVDALLRASGIRSRTVSLGPDWAHQTQMPMIGWTTDGRPVALIPNRRGYRIHDVSTGRRRPVEAKDAPLLDDTALALYPSLSGAQSFDELLRFALTGSRRDLVRFLLAGVTFGLLALAVPVSVGTVVPKLLAGGTDQLWWVGALLGAVTIVAGAALLVRNATAVRLQSRIQAVVEPAVWDRMLAQDVTFFRQFSTGDLVQRGNAIAQVRRVLSDVVVGAALSAFFSVTSVIVVMIAAPVLGLLLFAAMVVFGTVLVLLARRQERHEAEVYEAYGAVFGLLYSVLLGIDKIHAAGREIQAFGRWAALFRRQKLADSAALREQAAATAVASALQPLMVAVVLGGIVVFDLHPSVADLVVTGVAVGQVGLAVGQLGQLAASAYGIAPMLRRLQPILAKPTARGGLRDPGSLRGGVRLEEMSFSYPGATEPTLDRITLQAGPGEFVAVVGPSGAGKSTLIRMLLGFEQASSGFVAYDGLDLDDLEHRLVRRQIGTVLQHGTMLRGSLFDNIVGPASHLSHHDAWAAAELAGIADDLRALPMGLNTKIGESAQGLSGGQVQRLLIARALVRRPALLLLDEATSALDNATQSQIAERIAALDCTRIVIAHRLSTVRRADRIYVLDAGRITAVGTHDELLVTSPLYARLIRRQEVTP
jgi:NHLM bacteriocin system ABC transporter ATP-binding protein